MRRRYPPKFKSLAITFMMLGCFSIIAISYAASPLPLVKVEQQRLTVNAHNASIEDILRQFADQSGVAVEFYGSPNKLVSIEFSNVPIEEGVKRVLAKTNISFQYRREVSGGGNAEYRLDKILVVTDGAAVGIHRFEPSPAANENLPLPAPVDAAPTAFTANALPSPQPIAVDENPEVDRPEIGKGIFIKADRQQFETVTAVSLLSEFSGTTTSLKFGLTGANPAENEDDPPRDLAGVSLTSIPAGGLMEQLGLQVGDVVQDINGTQTASPEQVAEALQQGLGEEGGGILRIEVERGDTVEPIYVELDQPQP